MRPTEAETQNALNEGYERWLSIRRIRRMLVGLAAGETVGLFWSWLVRDAWAWWLIVQVVLLAGTLFVVVRLGGWLSGWMHGVTEVTRAVRRRNASG